MKISIIIPVKNGGEQLYRLLSALFAQNYKDIEVIIIDSGSNDSSLEIASWFPVKVHKILPESFSHSGTRNLGVKLASGEVLGFTVQDAWPQGSDCLERVVKHFVDEEVMAVGVKQVVPHLPWTNPLQWYRPVHEERVEVRKVDFDRLSEFDPEEIVNLFRLDNVCAFYRREALEELPFPQVEFAEDMFWAYEALRRGWKIVFDNRIKVYHYHHYEKKQKFMQRLQAELEAIKQLYERLGLSFTPERNSLIKQVLRVVYLTMIKRGYVPEHKIYWLLYNLRLIVWKWLFYRAFEHQAVKVVK